MCASLKPRTKVKEAIEAWVHKAADFILGLEISSYPRGTVEIGWMLTKVAKDQAPIHFFIAWTGPSKNGKLD